MRNGFVAVALLAVSLAGQAVAEVKAVIDGPTQAAAGDLVVLSGAQSVGEGYRWIARDGLQTLQCGGDARELAFASGKAGRYTFILVVADASAAIDYATHTVVVGGPVDPGPGDPPEDPEPTPGAWEELRKLASARASALHDADTAEAIAAAIIVTDQAMERACQAGQCPGLASAKAQIVAAIESALARRRGASLRVDWAGRWRREINGYLESKNPADVPTYRAAMRAVAVGLEEAR